MTWLHGFVVVIVLCVVDVASRCPTVVGGPITASITDTSLQTSRTAVRFPVVAFDVSTLGTTAVITANTSSGMIAFAANTDDHSTGLTGRQCPQGFFYRYAERLSRMGLTNGIIQISSAVNQTYAIAFVFDQLLNYEIQKDETVVLQLPSNFFGPLSGCTDPVTVATVTVKSSYAADGYRGFMAASTFASMIATGVFGFRLPGKTIDPQLLATLSLTSCAAQKERVLAGAYRLIAPFAFSESLGGMLGGNCIAIAVVWIVHAVVAVAVGKSRDAKSIEEAGAHVYFPRITFLFTMALYPGTVFTATRLIAVGAVDSNGGQIAGGVIAAIVFIIAVPIATYMYTVKGCLGEYHGYNLEAINTIWRIFAPSGNWMPETVRDSCGGVIGELHRHERPFALLVFASPALSAIVLAAEPQSTSGCMTQYVIFLTVQMVLVVVNVWCNPYRSKVDTALTAAGHIILSCCGALFASSTKEVITILRLEVAQTILLCFTWLRLANDVLVTLMERSAGFTFKSKWFAWHDGSRNDLSNPYEVKNDEKTDLFPDMLQDDTSMLPLPSPLSSLPSMVKPAHPPNIDDIFKQKPSAKRGAQDDDFDDPFGDDILSQDSRGGKSKKASMKPSSDSDDPFGSDSSPSLSKKKSSKPKLAGVAQKIMLAKKLQEGIAEAKEKREAQEMFGPSSEPDMLRARVEAGGAFDELNDMLGLDADRANPMGQGPSAFTAAQAENKAPAKKVATGDLNDRMKMPTVPKVAADDAPVKVFRVEFATKEKRMTLVPQDAKDFGSFCDGDSYVVLNNGGKEKELYVWIGKVSTPDEIKAAVSEAVALDNTIRSGFHKSVTSGGHKISRVLQSCETTSFLSLFPEQKISIIEGGVDDEGKSQARLYHVHGEGAKKMSLSVVPPTIDSLDDGDVFVLDYGFDVWIFQGSECSPFEREHARQYGEKLRATRAQCNVSVVTQDNAPDKFWKALGSSRKEAQGMTLKRLESFLPSSMNRIFVVRGQNDFKLEASGGDVGVLSLDSSNIMIVDFCSVIYVWVGANAPNYKEKRDEGLQRGVEYLKKYSDPKIPLIRVLEDHEGQTFNDLLL